MLNNLSFVTWPIQMEKLLIPAFKGYLQTASFPHTLTLFGSVMLGFTFSPPAEFVCWVSVLAAFTSQACPALSLHLPDLPVS